MTKGILLVLSGPSGVGKTTIAHIIKNDINGVFSISATTRPPSDSEQDGVDYNFITNEEFDEKLISDSFLEYAEVYGEHRYGTLREPVQNSLKNGKVVILDIDVQGAIQVKKIIPESKLVFILPPSEKILLERLRTRGREHEEVIQSRFLKAKSEIKKAIESNCYDIFITNTLLKKSVEEIKSFLGM